MLRAVLLSVLLCGPRQVASDSDELILSDWQMWKSSHGISYDGMVRTHMLNSSTKMICVCSYSFWLFFDALSFTSQDNIQRRAIWEENMREIEDNNQGFFMGTRMFTMAMNKYGDLVRTIHCFLIALFSTLSVKTNDGHKVLQCLCSPHIDETRIPGFARCHDRCPIREEREECFSTSAALQCWEVRRLVCWLQENGLCHWGEGSGKIVLNLFLSLDVSRHYHEQPEMCFSMFFTGLLWLLLGLQHYRSYWGTNIQEDGSANILEWAKPGRLFQSIWHLWLQRCLDGKRLRLCGPKRTAVHKHLSVHLSGTAHSRPSEHLQMFNILCPQISPMLTFSAVFPFSGHPALFLWQQTCSCTCQRL